MKRKPPTKSESERLAAVKRLPCIACRKRPWLFMQCGVTEGHHLLSGGRRRGHKYTVSLGVWHHRGVPLQGWSLNSMNMVYGPSLRLESKRFRAEFGDDESLLAETNKMLEQQSVEAA